MQQGVEIKSSTAFDNGVTHVTTYADDMSEATAALSEVNNEMESQEQ